MQLLGKAPSHFLPSAASSPVAPACWPQGKILPHPSARSARHWSPQDGGPKGKMIEGRSGGSGRGTRRESWAPPDSGSAHRRIAGLYRVPDSRPEAVPCAALAFPSLRRFLTAAPACWPQGKILPHPSARSARHSSPQDGGPKGKMIEGRSLRSALRTRRESWAPPDSGSAHRRIAGLYRVPDSRPEAVPCTALAYPSLRRCLTRRTCLLAPGKNSAAPKRTFISLHVALRIWAQRENDRRK